MGEHLKIKKKGLCDGTKLPIFVFATGLFLTGCFHPDHGVGQVKSSAPQNAPSVVKVTSSQKQKTKNPSGALTLRKALALALIQNPSLKSYAWEVRAKEAATLTAKKIPNPELEMDTEDLLGSGAFSKVKELQITARLNQVIELGGQRSARLGLARAAAKTAGWDYELARINTLSEISKAFWDVHCAQFCVKQNTVLVSLATAVVKVFVEKVEAGKVSPLLVSRARLSLSMARLELIKARRKLQETRQALSLMWGSSHPRFTRVVTKAPPLSPPPEFSSLVRRLEKSPRLSRWAALITESRKKLHLAKSHRVPNLSVRAGYRYLHGTKDSAIVFGFSIPIPIFYNHQGEVMEARLRVKKAQSMKEAARLRVQRHLARSLQRLSDAYQETHTIKKEILPQARINFDKIKDGYRIGKFGYLAVLDSQTTLFSAQRRYLEAFARYYAAKIDTEALLGEPLNP